MTRIAIQEKLDDKAVRPILVGRTAVGRATITVLGINLAHCVQGGNDVEIILCRW